MNQNLRERFSVMFSRIDVAKPEEVARYIRWLCRLDPVNRQLSLEKLDHEDDVEKIWGWNAPRQRAAKLLWQLISGDDDAEYFNQHFRDDEYSLIKHLANCKDILLSIQANLNWVLEAFMQRRKVDVSVGQGDWGEEWWLPQDQAAYVRQQLRRARGDLIEQPSWYKDSLTNVMMPYFQLATNDEDRSYIGVRIDRHSGRHVGTIARVFVEDSAGKQYPLPHTVFPFKERPGENFAWGYAGHGPSELARNILADACGGELELTKPFRREFVETVLMKYSWEEDFHLSRSTVLEWLSARGVNKRKLNEMARRVRELQIEVEPQIAEYKSRLAEAQKLGRMVNQRFDLVPQDFECALYVDLMRFFEQSGWVLRCNLCSFPISCDKSPRGSHQRSRWIAGRPIYHDECFAQHKLEQKRHYWSERMQTRAFRVSERQRAKKRRKSH